MRIRLSFVIILLLLVMGNSNCPLYSRCFPVPTVRYTPPPFAVGYFEVHNTQTGLPSNQIRCLLSVDDKILAGTEGGGLMLFQNESWISFTPQSTPPFPAQTVSSLVVGEDSDTVYAGTIAGIVRITGLKKSPAFELLKNDSPISRNILSLFLNEETLLFGSDAEIGEWSSAGPLIFKVSDGKSPGGFRSINKWSGSIWFGASDGLYRVRENILFKFEPDQADLGWIYSIEPGGKELYVGSSRGLFQFKGEKTRNLLPETWVTAISPTPGTSDYFKPSLQKMIETSLPDLSSIGTESQGKKNKLKEIENQVAVVNRIATALWQKRISGEYPTPADFQKYYGQLGKLNNLIKEYEGSLPSPNAALIKGLWVGTQEKGVILFAEDGQRRELTTENSKLPSNRITALASKADGETWMGTWDGGLLRYRKIKIKTLDPVKIWEGEANSVRLCGENLYVCSKKDGLLVFDPKDCKQIDHFKHPTIKDFHRSVTGVAIDRQGRLWTSGDQGIFLLDKGGWHRFTAKNGLPDDKISCLEVDRNGKIYVAGGKDKEISSHLAIFNGKDFSSYALPVIRNLLGLPPASAAIFLASLGLTETYLGNFDLKNASQAIAMYDDLRPEAEVSAMLGLNEYLLMGTREGSLFAFYGEGFKRVAREGTGKIGRVVGLKKRRNGDILLLADRKVMLMDGQHFLPVPPIMEKTVKQYTDIAIDGRNPDLFWVSFDSGDGTGGLGLFQDPLWSVMPVPMPVKSFALTESFIFILSGDSLFRVMSD